jgi:hypothetical protein
MGSSPAFVKVIDGGESERDSGCFVGMADRLCILVRSTE